MFRANVYSMEPLPKNVREEVQNGIDMVAAYMGHVAVSKDLRVRIPTNTRGQVDPAKARFGKLDMLTELHVMVVPLVERTHSDRLGIAGLGRGWAYVDPVATISYVDPLGPVSFTGLRATTSHEVAHAFGFVRPDASQWDPDSDGHCSNPSCLMHWAQKITPIHPDTVRRPSRIKEAFNKTVDTLLGIDEPPENCAHSQYDFCLACKVDLREHSDRNLNQLRADRLFRDKQVR